ncbi:MAG: ABC transporter substrate-binding protein, partial [Rhodospirillaceae bacterium]|nr:ABC transporter substrate-binding protein [Rhodospirillaceae bacterium]
GGKADVIVDWMPAALAWREKGVPLVNIAQIFKRSGMMLTCRRDSGIRTPQDLKGRTLGVWFSGNEYPFLSWMDKLGFKVDGATPDIKVVKQGFNVKLLLRRRADCVSTMSYNEYWMAIDGGLKPDRLIVFKYEDQGVATLEDGLYTTEAKLKDPAMHARLARFVRASARGWAYAIAHQDEATRIVLANDATRARTARHQRRMMGEIAKLVADQPKGIGYLEPADYERTVRTLLAGKSDPVITKPPQGAWTHTVIEAARPK